MTTAPLDDTAVTRVLVITAHPDDVDFGAGGAVATWTSQGLEVSYCVITDGDAGGFDPAVPRSEIPAIRRAEQQTAAAVLGVGRVDFLGYRDGQLAVTYELRRDLSRVIREVRPQRVVCMSPERNWQRIGASHPDHLAAGEAALQAVYPDARNPFAHPELLAAGLQEWAVSEVWVMGHPLGTTYVDVTDALPRKVEALRAHASQTGHWEPGRLETLLQDWAAGIASEAGLDPGRYAEKFLLFPTA